MNPGGRYRSSWDSPAPPNTPGGNVKPLVGIIDYRTGNSTSFSYALGHIGVPNVLARTPKEAAEATHLVLPGVGAADVTMESLRDAGWVNYLGERVLADGIPFLGVCVGLQVLFDYSEEGDTECLGWLPGSVQRFETPGLRVPHMGWNEASPSPAASEVFGEGGYFYFVNSYHAVPADPADVVATTDYGVTFASAVGRGNILATQFHTEKSGPVGLSLLRRFANSTAPTGEDDAQKEGASNAR